MIQLSLSNINEHSPYLVEFRTIKKAIVERFCCSPTIAFSLFFIFEVS